MAITHEMYSQILGGKTLGRVRKQQSDMIMDATFTGDIQYQVAYLFDYYHTTPENRLRLVGFNPEEDQNAIPVEIKFIAHAKKTYEKDEVTQHIQFRPGHICPVNYYEEMFGGRYGAEYPVGLYMWIADESGVYRRWLVVMQADAFENQFPTYEVLRCNNIYRWVKNGKFYEFPGVTRSQNSQIMRFIGETLCRKFSNCWKNSLGRIFTDRVNQQRSRFRPKRSTGKVRQAPENGNHLSLLDMVLICSNLIGDYEKFCLSCNKGQTSGRSCFMVPLKS